MSRMYAYVRSRELESTYPGLPTTGVWPITDLRIRRGWGTPTEAEWPYDGNKAHWPPTEPPGIDTKANAFRIGIYQRIRNVDECRTALAKGASVVVSLRIVEADWSNAVLGNIPLPKLGEMVGENHCVALVNCDNNSQTFRFCNSWGATWGDQGHGTISFKYIEEYFTEAWIIVPGAERLRIPTQTKGIVVADWAIHDCLSPSRLRGIEVFDATNNECIGWSFMVDRENCTDIEEFFVRPKYRNQGHGRSIAESIKASSDPKLPLRLWIPHVDVPHAYKVGPSSIFKRLGLRRRATTRKWAGQVALP